MNQEQIERLETLQSKTNLTAKEKSELAELLKLQANDNGDDFIESKMEEEVGHKAASKERKPLSYRIKGEIVEIQTLEGKNGEFIAVNLVDHTGFRYRIDVPTSFWEKGKYSERFSTGSIVEVKLEKTIKDVTTFFNKESERHEFHSQTNESRFGGEFTKCAEWEFNDKRKEYQRAIKTELVNSTYNKMLEKSSQPQALAELLKAIV